MRRCREKTWRPHTQAFTAPPHLCESHLWKMTTQKELKVTLTSEVSYIIVHTVDYISESDNLTISKLLEGDDVTARSGKTRMTQGQQQLG